MEGVREEDFREIDFFVRFSLGLFIEKMNDKTSIDKDFMETLAYETLCDIGGIDPSPMSGVDKIMEAINYE